MITLLAFGFGCVAGSLLTHYWPRVRGALGAARDGVLGKPRAPARTITETKAPVEQSPKRRQYTIGSVLANFGEFGAWCLRNWKWIALVILAIIIVFAARSCGDSFGWGKSRGEIRRDAERNEETLEARNETTLAGAEEGERFRNDARAINDELERGSEQLESIPREISDLDFMRSWRDLDRSLLDAGSPAR